MKRKPRVYTGDLDTVPFKFVSCLCKGHRVIFVLRLDMRFANFLCRFACFALFYISEKRIVGFSHTQHNILNNLAWQRLPVWVGSLFQLRNMSGHCVSRYIFTKQTVIPTLQAHNMHMYLVHVIKQVAKFVCVLLILYLIFISFSHDMPFL